MLCSRNYSHKTNFIYQNGLGLFIVKLKQIILIEKFPIQTLILIYSLSDKNQLLSYGKQSVFDSDLKSFMNL